MWGREGGEEEAGKRRREGERTGEGGGRTMERRKYGTFWSQWSFPRQAGAPGPGSVSLAAPTAGAPQRISPL